MNNKWTYYWWLYTLYMVFVVIITTSIFSDLTTLKDNERIQIFFGGVGVSSEVVETDLVQYLLDYSPQDIKEVVFETIDSSIPSFQEILFTRAISVGDLIILPESAIRVNTGETYFTPLDVSDVYTFFGDDVHLYEENGVPYGIYLNKVVTSNNFTSLLQSGDDNVYVLFFNAFSLNTGDWNDDGVDADIAAIDCAKWFLTEEETDD